MKRPLLLTADLLAQSLAEINPSASFESLVHLPLTCLIQSTLTTKSHQARYMGSTFNVDFKSEAISRKSGLESEATNTVSVSEARPLEPENIPKTNHANSTLTAREVSVLSEVVGLSFLAAGNILSASL